MSTNPERDKFLADQAGRFGEPIRAFALGRVVSGPPLGAELIFVLVGASAVYLVPSAQDASIFGIPLPGRKTETAEPRTLARSQVIEFMAVRPTGWWARWTSPQEVVSLRASEPNGPVEWRFQLIREASPFVQEWAAAWSDN